MNLLVFCLILRLNVIYPALASQEEAATTELKKGVKMAVHHSRDTAHKQWAETRCVCIYVCAFCHVCFCVPILGHQY
jgi:hypothetical protein